MAENSMFDTAQSSDETADSPSDISFVADTREEVLAEELAKRLGDASGLPFYLAATKKYSEFYLRQILARVLEIPAEQIRTSRGALFNWFLRHYDKKSHEHKTSSDHRP